MCCYRRVTCRSAAFRRSSTGTPCVLEVILTWLIPIVRLGREIYNGDGNFTTSNANYLVCITQRANTLHTLIHNTRSFRCARHVSVTSSAAFHGNGKHSADPTARALTFKRPDQSSESARSASRSSVDFSTAAARDFTSSSRRPLYAPDPGIVGEAACCSCRLAAAGCCVHPCDQTRSYSRNLYHFSTTSAARHRQRSLR